MIPFIYRFHGHGSLRYVYKNGQPARSRLMTIKVAPNDRRQLSRIAVVISKKVLKSAVSRNRVRRRVYEVMRVRIPQFKGVFDIAIIISSSEVMHLPQAELTELIDTQLTQLSVYETL